ncbi:MAG: efflux RND transporter permease subunit [Opitutaceae bacterium]|nr:efflux RND transporter permease subunit [Opitutaceae bacterium]
MHPSPHSQPAHGGLAQYFVEKRGVAWLLLIALLAWGWFAYRQLPQQEDPTIPQRTALVVTQFPGATSEKVENLVTKPLEKKIAELATLDEIKSESRHGTSVITVSLQPQSDARISQDWDKLRAKLAEVRLPDGARSPFLNTDFGNTITLLYAIASDPIPAGEIVARAALVRDALSALRAGKPGEGRATLVVFYPAAMGRGVRDSRAQRFSEGLTKSGLAGDIVIADRGGLLLIDFSTPATRTILERYLNEFVRGMAGTDGEQHPDFLRPFFLIGNEDPTPAVRALEMPRHSYRDLEKVAEDFEDELRQISDVGRTGRVAIVPEQIYLDYSSAKLAALQIARPQLANAIAARNALIPGGTFRTEGLNLPVQVSGEFKAEDELLDTVVASAPDGTPVYLRDLVRVQRGYENPLGYHFNFFGRARPDSELRRQRAVVVSIEMRDGAHIGKFAERVKDLVRDFQHRQPDGVHLTIISNQPASVEERVNLFIHSFLEAVLIVVAVALLLMDWRSAIVVAAAIPLTVAFTFGGMQLLGIPLHQISIAGLIIALGVLVDDPVVAADGINREIAHGQPRRIAAWLGPVKLARPILYGTIINIAAFLPLVLLPGDKGAFIYALPVVVTLALVGSRLVSMTFTPLLGYFVLRGQKGLEEGAEVRSFILFRWVDRAILWMLPRYQRLLERALDHPWRTVLLVYGLLIASFGLTPFFGKQFFPPAERNQFVIDLELPKNASPLQMRDTSHRVAELLRQHKEIDNIGVFYGGTAPRFYYNISPKEPAAYLAQFVVNTYDMNAVVPLLEKIRAEIDASVPGARILARQLEQGPPLEFPIQIRLTGPDLDTLRRLADDYSTVLRKHGGYKVHDDLGQRLPTLRIDVDQERATTLGVDNQRIGSLASVAFSASRITEVREGDHLVPVNLRLRPDEVTEVDRIRSAYVESSRGGLIPLESFSRITIDPAFATVPHFAQLRTVTVKSMAPVGVLAASVLESAMPELKTIALPEGYRADFAGEQRELDKVRREMGAVFGVSLAAIFLAIVLQFGSVTKSLVVMATVPLGAIGAFAGIVLFQTNMGFMAFLAVVSLAGVIVSHIIVLSDFIEEARAEGMPLRQALVRAGLVRLRPVIVTVLSTVCGLIPLAEKGGLLWRPLTAVHIVGLLCATVLTLVVLPVIYMIFTEKLKWIR